MLSLIRVILRDLLHFFFLWFPLTFRHKVYKISLWPWCVYFDMVSPEKGRMDTVALTQFQLTHCHRKKNLKGLQNQSCNRCTQQQSLPLRSSRHADKDLMISLSKAGMKEVLRGRLLHVVWRSWWSLVEKETSSDRGMLSERPVAGS